MQTVRVVDSVVDSVVDVTLTFVGGRVARYEARPPLAINPPRLVPFPPSPSWLGVQWLGVQWLGVQWLGV